MARLVSYTDGDVPIGGQTWLDNNLAVTVTAVRPPADDNDLGSVSITYDWGTADDVDPTRLGAYIAD
ncbi:hypothetical protein [Streptomyces ardesiacus]|uniref:hypothetical protein n=1 Tax=Streptomyces ardesiacus TaxID=285564 RepID=UPI00363A34B3